MATAECRKQYLAPRASMPPCLLACSRSRFGTASLKEGGGLNFCACRGNFSLGPFRCTNPPAAFWKPRKEHPGEASCRPLARNASGKGTVPSKKILFLDLQLPLAATTPTNTQDAPKWPKTLPSSPKFTTSTRTKFKTTLYLNLFCQGPPLCSRIKRSALGESRKRPRTLIFFFFFFFLLGSHRCTKSVVPKNRGL